MQEEERDLGVQKVERDVGWPPNKMGYLGGAPESRKEMNPLQPRNARSPESQVDMNVA